MVRLETLLFVFICFIHNSLQHTSYEGISQHGIYDNRIQPDQAAFVTQYSTPQLIPPPPPSATIVGVPIAPSQNLARLRNMCFFSICKAYIHECHWYCDPARQIDQNRCRECLGARGASCIQCFEL